MVGTSAQLSRGIAVNRMIRRVLYRAVAWREALGELPPVCRNYKVRIVRFPAGMPLRAKVIVDQVLDQHGVRIEEIRSTYRSYRLREPRQCICYRLLSETRLTSEQVGKMVNRDHTTVIHAARVFAARNQLRFDGRYWVLCRGNPSPVRELPSRLAVAS